MKLWDKGYSINNLIETYTVGNDRVLDMKLAKYDVLGNIAHAKMLHKIGILTEKELQDVEKGLQEIQTQIEEGTFIIEDNFEDVHSKIEFELTQKIGEAGKKIHTARSRNDQVLVDLHLYIKDELKEIKELTKNLFDLLLKLSEKHKDILIPGYTHLQVAMPSSFGLWFGAYAESMIDDIIFLNAASKIADQNPLGSAAGYGSSFPIDRQMTTDLLGFSKMHYNVIAAQMSRGKLEKTVAFALASLAGTLSKFAMDVCLYNSQNFGFLSFPKELTTGSSIMPHKQNPDVFELLRGKSNKIQNLPAELIMITNNLPSGYHRDFQLLKESTIEAIETTKENLIVCHFMLENIIIHENTMDNSLYDYVYSVEELNKLVLNGMSFREAYQKLGKQILEGNFNPEKTVKHTHEGSIGNLCLKEIKAKFDEVF
ncbi:argininosuccinate lyase [Bernardetia litoralis DSM 6794]|uniref:Argininosuccinate lyase n=1 Tax=Bernardetia litoralis (strain ATCC 23117 / DSM 6794 / NBRC 15988 / NCIMB 1366 / Fx l1 / Sio-4) TaxID=880071 RepID=I4AQX8_BERLS|nr:argininosuccinate lyase [Bernardetia litoralis]AFM06363.1 argininosuccinate lyase [Bernardetia litoralis DSM 6794]